RKGFAPFVSSKLKNLQILASSLLPRAAYTWSLCPGQSWNLRIANYWLRSATPGPWARVAHLPRNAPRLSSLVCYCGRGAHAGRVHSRGGGGLHSCRPPEESKLLE